MTNRSQVLAAVIAAYEQAAIAGGISSASVAVYRDTPFAETDLPAANLLRGGDTPEDAIGSPTAKAALRLSIALYAKGSTRFEIVDRVEEGIRVALAAPLHYAVTNISMATEWDSDELVASYAAAKISLIIEYIQ